MPTDPKLSQLRSDFNKSSMAKPTAPAKPATPAKSASKPAPALKVPPPAFGKKVNTQLALDHAHGQKVSAAKPPAVKQGSPKQAKQAFAKSAAKGNAKQSFNKAAQKGK